MSAPAAGYVEFGGVLFACYTQEEREHYEGLKAQETAQDRDEPAPVAEPETVAEPEPEPEAEAEPEPAPSTSAPRSSKPKAAKKK